MSEFHITAEIMKEVENLKKSIRELCPEIMDSGSDFSHLLTTDDDTSRLIDYRIKLLKENSEREKKLADSNS